jgi:hypothetical protein
MPYDPSEYWTPERREQQRIKMLQRAGKLPSPPQPRGPESIRGFDTLQLWQCAKDVGHLLTLSAGKLYTCNTNTGHGHGCGLVWNTDQHDSFRCPNCRFTGRVLGIRSCFVCSEFHQLTEASLVSKTWGYECYACRAEDPARPWYFATSDAARAHWDDHMRGSIERERDGFTEVVSLPPVPEGRTE